jgi:ATP-dependent DNA ligase
MVFDCLYARNKDLRRQPLYVRRNVIAWEEVLTRGHEGLVAKDPAAPYVGGRTLKWLKVKQPRYREGQRGWGPKR